MNKLYTLIFAVTLHCIATFSAEASLIYCFDNSQHPDVDFVGVLADNFHIFFGPDILHADDEYNLFIGETAGGNEISERLNISFDFDVEGFGSGDTLNIIPTSDSFFATFEILQGSFNISSVSAAFTDNGKKRLFFGTPVRATSPSVPVPAPSTSLILLLGLAMCVYLLKKRVNNNVELANNLSLAEA